MARFCIISVLWITSLVAAAKTEVMVLRDFQNIGNVSVTANLHLLTRQKTGVRTKLRCASACMELECHCASFLFDGSSGGVCHMFAKTLSSGIGNSTGANKITECVLPRVLSNAVLLDYTGCNATYDCEFGYTSIASIDPATTTCQTNETWAPSDYACVEIPCPSPKVLENGKSEVTSLQVGGIATYTCMTDYINRGGPKDTLTCQLGGTWLGNINMVCYPVNVQYTFEVRTSDKDQVKKGKDVYVILTGDYGTARINFPIDFPSGTTKTYTGSHPDVGKLTRVVVGHESSKNWRLSSISIRTAAHGLRYISVHEWMASSVKTVYEV